MILALDTTHEFGSLALWGATGRVEEVAFHSEDGFAHVLFDAVDTLLRKHALRPADLSAFASAQGPGSFTGVRVCLTAIKGLAEATGKPAFGVSNLAAMARMAGVPGVVPFFDARRGEVFAALPNGEEIVAPYPALLAQLPPGTPLASFDFAAFPAEGHPTVVLSRSLAGAIAQISWERYQQGERPDPILLDANYVRRSDAELHWREA
ncbi:MAG: tRNA (adenosine(37)-N6)-threonylcarbamoyltransferase complex dimerization subunit type 1 TsaB [Bryobacter sp.]|nr:tRNA (adenosine(37)-N6)-threonylcarbamoyltransferase complex dimerization subunit type 1 TsaB [Bryobacter sp.]